MLDFSYARLHWSCADRILWYGHAVKAIDGTTIRIPNTPENRKEFQTKKNQALDLLTRETLHDESGYRPIITFDRGYPSGELISHIDELGSLFLMRCPSTNIKNICSCPQGISDTSISYHNRKIKICVLRFFLDSGNEEILITNVPDSGIGLSRFQWLYNMRWSIMPISVNLCSSLELYDIIKKKGGFV